MNELDLALTPAEFDLALQRALAGATDPGFERRYRRELAEISQEKKTAAQEAGLLPPDLPWSTE